MSNYFYVVKKFSADFLNFFHIFFILYFFFIVTITSLSFFLKITFDNILYYKILYIFLYFISGYVIFLSEKKFNLLKIIFYSFFILIISFISREISINILEISPDGFSHQLKSSYYFANGFNPYYDTCGTLIGNRNLDLINFFSVAGYTLQYASAGIHFLENIFFHLGSDDTPIDVFKTMKLIVLISSIYPVAHSLKLMNVPKFNFLITLIILLNPIIFNGLMNSYKDIYGYYFFLHVLYYFILLIKNDKFDNKNFSYFIIGIILLSIPKMNFAIYSILFFISFLIIFFIKFKIKKILIFGALIPFIILTIYSFTPTTKNVVYPRVIQDKILQKDLPHCYDKYLVTPFSPGDYRNKYINSTNHVKLFYESLFLKASRDDAENFTTIKPTIKKLFFLKKSDLKYYIFNTTPMIGAAGPLFGLAFFLSLLANIFYIIKSKEKNLRNYKLELFFILIFLLILIFPYPNLYRFVPFVWLLPIILLLNLLRKNKKIISLVIICILGANLLVVNSLNIAGHFISQIMIKEQIKFYERNLDPDDQIEVYLSNWEIVVFHIDNILNNKIRKNPNLIKRLSLTDESCPKELRLIIHNTETFLCLKSNHLDKINYFNRYANSMLTPYLFLKKIWN